MLRAYEKSESETTKYKLKINRNSVRSLYGGLKFEGRDAVSIKPLVPRSFKLQFSVIDSNRVADYDENIISDHWNYHVIEQSWCQKLCNFLKHGVYRRTFPVILCYLIAHYTFATVMITTICHQDIVDGSKLNISNQMEHSIPYNAVQFLFQYFNDTTNTNVVKFCVNYPEANYIWREKEHNMTRVLTLLIGFYVGFIVRTWWQQIRLFPTIDGLCMSMGSFLVSDSEVDEDEVGVEIGRTWISIKRFKKDIARLFLLSWTMCLCRISKPLKDAFPFPKSFNDKKLLTRREFHRLKTDTNDDCWLEKWTTPLLWVNKMICSVNKDSIIMDNHGNVENRVRFRDAKEIGIELFAFKKHLQQLSNQYYYKIPDLMQQCITIAMYFFMFLGIFAGQSLTFHIGDKRSMFEKLITDFPFYYCIKYILLIGWLKTAKDLESPFGQNV